jgi:DNA-binding transcriptional ArsR family regulator
MLTLEFRHGSRTPVRFAKSPLWETVAFARLVARGDRERTRDIVTAREIPLLGALLARELPYTPDFLAPPPLQTEQTFEEELRRMRGISPEVVAAELSRMQSGLRRSTVAAPLPRYRACPGRLLPALADELTLVWRRGLHQQWRRLQSILDGDILVRARRLALDGPGGMFPDLPDLEFGDRHLTVKSGRGSRRVMLDRELLLVPTVFGWPTLFAVLDPPWLLSVYYPARGAGEIWQAAADTPDRLETLAGRTRARVLKAVGLPSTTTQVAARLRIAPASASQHLQRLHSAGLVCRTRAGSVVIYALTDVGAELLSLLVPAS